MKTENLAKAFIISEEYPRWICLNPVVTPERAVLRSKFDPVKALSYGILGSSLPTVTRSGIEVLACCNALNGWG